MIPYIAILIFLIVIILYEVYTMTEAFTTDASGNSVTVDASGNILRVDASGNAVVPTDASGNQIRLSLTDLFGLLGPLRMKQQKENTVQDLAPADVTSSESSTREVEDRIAKAIAKQVKDDILRQRSLDDVYDQYAPCDLTTAEAQGQEYLEPRRSNVPDMSEYIRKDSIPCWNCSIP